MKTFLQPLTKTLVWCCVSLFFTQFAFSQGTEKIKLPITFDNAAVNYDLVSFGSATAAIVADPKNAANKVCSMGKPNGAETWAGVTVGNSALAVPVQFSAGNTTFKMDVYSPIAGVSVLLKLENAANGAVSVETIAKVTQANTWETLSFDFSKTEAGTPALNLSATYSKVVVFMNFGVAGSADGEAVYYFDKISHLPTDNYTGTVIGNALPVTFDLANKDYQLADFGGNASTLGADPTNAANKVAVTTKSNTAELWAGTTIFGSAGFDTKVPLTAATPSMSVRVYSPVAGIKVRLKLEDATDGTKSVETEVTVPEAKKWLTLVFNFTKNAAGTAAINYAYNYNKASIFFNFGITGAAAGEQVYYWDDVSIYKINGTATEDTETPNGFTLAQNYPNPFNPSTNISYELAKAGDVRLAVYDIMGREVAVLVQQQMSAGAHTIRFDASTLKSGVYFYRLEMNGQSTMHQMALVR